MATKRKIARGRPLPTPARRSGKRAARHAKSKSVHPLISHLFGSHPSGRPHPDERLRHSVGNPLAIAHPGPLLPYHESRRILSLRRFQYRLWSVVLALAILLFFALSFIEIGESWFHLLPPPSNSHAELMFWADLLAIGIFALEFWALYRQYTNKMLFLRHNWLGILAILPIGLLLRGARVVESIESLRALQLAGKLDEMAVVFPGVSIFRSEKSILSLHALSAAISHLMLQVQNGLAHFSVVTDFIELTAQSFLRLLRR